MHGITPDGKSPLAGTAFDGKNEARRYIAIDWSVRVATPMWLDSAGKTEDAAALRSLEPVTGLETYREARDLVSVIYRGTKESRYIQLATGARAEWAINAAYTLVGLESGMDSMEMTCAANAASSGNLPYAERYMADAIEAVQESAIEMFVSAIDPRIP